MYFNPNIESSYRENNLGKTLYDVVLKLKPKKIVEFGCLYGYSTVCMALALKELNQGKIYCYDLYDSYKYLHSTMSLTQNNIKKFGVEEFVEFKVKDYNDWLTDPEDFDLLHLDISNTGDIIVKTYNALLQNLNKGATILFEGGSEERDKVSWVSKYHQTPINFVKPIVPFKILNPNFPSISIISNECI